MMRYGEMGGAVSVGAPRKAPRRPLAKALSLSGLSGYLSAQGDVVGSLVDQTPGCSLRYTTYYAAVREPPASCHRWMLRPQLRPVSGEWEASRLSPWPIILHTAQR